MVQYFFALTVYSCDDGVWLRIMDDSYLIGIECFTVILTSLQNTQFLAKFFGTIYQSLVPSAFPCFNEECVSPSLVIEAILSACS